MEEKAIDSRALNWIWVKDLASRGLWKFPEEIVRSHQVPITRYTRKVYPSSNLMKDSPYLT